MASLDFLVTTKNSPSPRGITSICSAHPLVIEAALLNGRKTGATVLIEATCNQVNQFGGYTGMTPADFVGFVRAIADRVGCPRQDLLLGGDHLGPLAWADETPETAMRKAKDLVKAYVSAGFGKIHLDCSMPCAGEGVLPLERIAQRSAELAMVAEQTAAATGTAFPRYVIGSEVPPAGGARSAEAKLTITQPAEAARTIEATHGAFLARGLEAAWGRVLALVVQPGVEFGDRTVHAYSRPAASGLKDFIESEAGLVFEAHSTDYQSRTALRQLVEDHFAILKVGPWLTFALREAVFALADMEAELEAGETSHIRLTLEDEMLRNPVHWQNHYAGTPEQQKIARTTSFSDRIRYYWSAPAVQSAFTLLMKNLGDRPLPLTLLEKHLPAQHQKICSGDLQNQPRLVLLDHVTDVLTVYAEACAE